MKTDTTKALEHGIFRETHRYRMMGCPEVTIGWFGKERVDYLTLDHKGTWRCYEIKSSVTDFRSKAAITFVGHLNYYVLTQELYDAVKDEIPKGIGVYVGRTLVTKPQSRQLVVDHETLSKSMIRSLSREYDQKIMSGQEDYLRPLRQRIAGLEAESVRLHKDERAMRKEIRRLESVIKEGTKNERV